MPSKLKPHKRAATKKPKVSYEMRYNRVFADTLHKIKEKTEREQAQALKKERRKFISSISHRSGNRKIDIKLLASKVFDLKRELEELKACGV